MESKDFKLNALVWAKMKGFSPWPAKVAFPYDGKMPRSKKAHHFIYFFGTRNYAWILDECIIPHSRKMLQNIKTYKKISNTMKMAIEELKMESRKILKKRKKPLKVQVKMEPTDEIPLQLHNSTKKKSKSLASKNKLAIIKRKPKKQRSSQIRTNSKKDSLQVEKKRRDCSLVKVKTEPLDPSDQNSLQQNNTTEKSKKPISITKTMIVKKKAINQPISNVISNDSKNCSTLVKKNSKRLLRVQVKKNPIGPSIKKSMKLKNDPKSPKKTTSKNKIQMGGKYSKKPSKVQVRNKSIQPCYKKPIELKNTQTNTRKETLRKLAIKPISKNKAKIVKKTTKKQPTFDMLIDIKEEPTFETEGITTRNSTRKNRTVKKQCAMGMVSDPKESTCEIIENVAKKSTSKNKTKIEKKTPKKQYPFGTLCDIKKEPTFVSKRIATKKSTSESKTVIEKKSTKKQNLSGMVSDLEPITGIFKTITKKSTSKNETKIVKKNFKYRPIQVRASGLENKLHKKRKSEKQPVQVIKKRQLPYSTRFATHIKRVKDKRRVVRKIPENLHPELNPAFKMASADFDRSSLGEFQKVTKNSLLVTDLHSHSESKNVSFVSPCNDSLIYRASTSRENPVCDFKSTAKMVGFLGVGKMGGLMIKNLLQSGHSVIAWNRSMHDTFIEVIELGAKKVQTPAEVICLCDITFCCMLDAEAVKTVVFSRNGVLDGFHKMPRIQSYERSKSYVEMSSIDPTTSQEISEVIIGSGGRYLEAPMVGSIQQMNEKAMVILAGGSRDLFDECQVYFAAMASHALFIGYDVGCASKLNLLASMIFGSTYAALGEAVELAKKCNISKHDFLDTIRNGPLSCPLMINKATVMYDNSTIVEHPLRHQQKDLNMAISMNEDYNQPLVVAAAANEAYKRAANHYSEYDAAAVHRNYQI